MDTFGQQLKFYRQRCSDKRLNKGRLSQDRFGELVGVALGTVGYTYGTVSDWERDVTIISAQDRTLLVAIVRVLRENEGLRTLEEANELLLSGHYARLSEVDSEQLFPSEYQQPPGEAPDFWAANFPKLVGLVQLLGKSRTPFGWVSQFVALLALPGEHLRSVQMLRGGLWLGIWLAAWELLLPYLRWPFDDLAARWQALLFLGGGSVLVPTAVGLLTAYRPSPYWQNKLSIHRVQFYLYTVQGAFVGFYTAYLSLLGIQIIFFTLAPPGAGPWLQSIGLTLTLILSFVGAKYIPFNIFEAYGNLASRHGVIFWIYILIGPGLAAGWHVFFPDMLAPPLGAGSIVAAFILLSGILAWRHKQGKSSIIPASTWILLLGLPTILYVGSEQSWVDAGLMMGILLPAAVLLKRGGK